MFIWFFFPLSPRKIGWIAECALVICWMWAWWLGLLAPQFTYWKLLPLYLIAGVALYGLSCLITGVPIALLQTVSRRPTIDSFWWWRVVLITPLHEELIWRLAAQSLLVLFMAHLGDIGIGLALILISISFTALHQSVWKRTRHALELMLFAFVLSVSIYFCNDLLLPLCLHAVRNFLIIQRPAENEI